MITVYGARGPGSGPAAPQTAIMDGRAVCYVNRPQRHTTYTLRYALLDYGRFSSHRERPAGPFTSLTRSHQSSPGPEAGRCDLDVALLEDQLLLRPDQ